MAKKRQEAQADWPDGWHDGFMSAVDLEKSLAELAPYDSYPAWTLKGYIHCLLGQLERSDEWFLRAESICEARRGAGGADNITRHRMKGYMLDHALFRAAVGLEPEAARERVRRILESMKDAGFPADSILAQSTAESEAKLAVFDGAWQEALEAFEKQVLYFGDSLNAQFFSAGSTIGAAACAKALGDDARAERYIEVATLGVRVIDYVQTQAVYVTRLHAVLASWGRDDDAAEWTAWLETLPVAESTRQGFCRRAELLADAARRGSLALA